MIRRILPMIALAALPALGHAIEIEFQVPVSLKNIDPAVDYVEINCGQWWPEERRRNNGVSSPRIPLRASGGAKAYSGVVKIVQSWPGTTSPTGKYICSLSFRSNSDSSNYFNSMPAAAGSRDTREIIGDYSELRSSASGGKIDLRDKLIKPKKD